MFSHVMVGANDIEASKKFYDAILGVLGAGEPMRDVKEDGTVRLFYIHNGGTMSVSEPINGEPACGANGGTSIEDPPGPRESPMGTLNLAYVLDPAGNKICALNRGG